MDVQPTKVFQILFHLFGYPNNLHFPPKIIAIIFFDFCVERLLGGINHGIVIVIDPESVGRNIVSRIGVRYLSIAIGINQQFAANLRTKREIKRF